MEQNKYLDETKSWSTLTVSINRFGITTSRHTQKLHYGKTQKGTPQKSHPFQTYLLYRQGRYPSLKSIFRGGRKHPPYYFTIKPKQK